MAQHDIKVHAKSVDTVRPTVAGAEVADIGLPLGAERPLLIQQRFDTPVEIDPGRTARQDQQFGLADQGAADGELLLLATG